MPMQTPGSRSRAPKCSIPTPKGSIRTPNKQMASPKTSLSAFRGVVAKGGIEPPTHGFSVVFYGVNRCTSGPPSLVEVRQGSPSVLRFSQVLGSEPRLSVFIALKPSMNYLPRFIVTSERKQMRLLILHPTKKHLHVGTTVGIALR